jgi:hypothetical protein
MQGRANKACHAANDGTFQDEVQKNNGGTTRKKKCSTDKTRDG